MSSLAEHRARWHEQDVAKSLARAPERRAGFQTSSGIPVDRVYGPAEALAESCPELSAGYLAELGFPGEFPYTRGVHRDHVSRPSLDDAPVRRLRHGGRKSTSATGTCCRKGRRDCRSPSTCPRRWATTPTTRSRAGEVGEVGVAIDSLADMETLFDGIPLDQVSTSMTINAPAAILLALYVLVARGAGRPTRASSRGTVQNDMLKEYIARGTYIYPPRPVDAPHRPTCSRTARGERAALEHDLDLAATTSAKPARTAVQEVAFTLANAHRLRARRRSPRAWRSTTSRRGCRSSSTRTTISSRRSPSSAPRGACGRTIMRERFGADEPEG